MLSIVQIVQSESMLGSRDYTFPENKDFAMFLCSDSKDFSTKAVLENPCMASDGDLGFAYGTIENPHDPIYEGFAVTQTSYAAMNEMQVAEKIHLAYDGSTNIEKIFSEVFPQSYGMLWLHHGSVGGKNGVCNQQWYQFAPVNSDIIDSIKKEYSLIMGQDLLPF